ncbi:unnamed protein product, partial [Adineta steineri]
ILLNATPGLFIFVVYVCNRRVVALYRGFPTITDAIEDRNITNIQQQISIVTYFIHSAISVLHPPNKIQSIL